MNGAKILTTTLISTFKPLHECITALVTNSLQNGQFWVRPTSSTHHSLWETRLFCTVFIQNICGRPSGFFHSTSNKEVKICQPSDVHCCHMGTAIKHPVPDQVKPSFVILTSGHSDTQHWAPECPEAPDVKNYKWWLNLVWHRMLYGGNHMATVGVKGLKCLCC